MIQDQRTYFCLKYKRPLTTAAIPEEASKGSRRYDTKVSRAEAMAIKGLGTLGRDSSRAVVSRSSHAEGEWIGRVCVRMVCVQSGGQCRLGADQWAACYARGVSVWMVTVWLVS